MRRRQFLVLLLWPCYLSAQMKILGVSNEQKALYKLFSNTPSYLKRSSNLYVFTDKSIYVPNEVVWFSSFEFNTKKDSAFHPFFMLLVDRQQKKSVWSGRFLEKDNFTAGSFVIPDSISDGDYVLVAYSDNYIPSQPLSIFYKNIYVRSTREPAFTIMPFEGFPVITEDSITLKYLISSPKPGFVENASIAYNLYVDDVREGSGKIKIGQNGEAHFKIKTSPYWKYKNLDLVMRVSKNGSIKDVVFPIYDPNQKIRAPFLRVLQDNNANCIVVNFGNIIPLKKYALAVYDERGDIYNGDFYLRSSIGKMRLPIDSMPEGYIHVAILDSGGQKIAEDALVLKHERPVVSIEIDSLQHSSRSLVAVKIKCKGANGKPIAARLSISCALNRRIKDTLTSIGKYFFSDSAISTHSMNSFGGKVSYFNKPTNGKVNLLLLGGLHFQSFNSDSFGDFKLKPDMMLSHDQRDLLVSVVDKSPDGYAIEMREPDLDMNNNLSKLYFPTFSDRANDDARDGLTDQERKNWKEMLKPFVLLNKSSDDYFTLSEKNAQGYDDDVWICSCMHWKCTACPPAIRPLDGGTYYDRLNQRYITYNRHHGDEKQKKAKSYLKKTQSLGYYSDDFSVVDNRNSSDVELSSTLFWAPFIRFEKNGEKEYSFYSNDLKGRFKISVEGYTELGPLHEVAEFIVK